MSALQRLPLASRLGLSAAIASTALLGGAYYFQYIVGLDPCDLCLWQRYPHMMVIAAGLAAVACFAAPRLALVLTLVAISGLLITAGIGVFHVGVEQHWWQAPQTCSGRIPVGLSTEALKKYLLSTKMVRCDEVAWKMWGVSMAGWNAILSGGLAFLLVANVGKYLRERQ
jgi:disulfide bond formation protein DsbB